MQNAVPRPFPGIGEGVTIEIRQKYFNTISQKHWLKSSLHREYSSLFKSRTTSFPMGEIKKNTVKIRSRILFSKSCGPNSTKRGTKHSLVNSKTV